MLPRVQVRGGKSLTRDVALGSERTQVLLDQALDGIVRQWNLDDCSLMLMRSFVVPVNEQERRSITLTQGAQLCRVTRDLRGLDDKPTVSGLGECLVRPCRCHLFGYGLGVMHV